MAVNLRISLSRQLAYVNDAVLLSRETPVTEIVPEVTVTSHVLVTLGFDLDVTLIIVLPTLAPVTTPLSSTVAIAVLLELQVTSLFVALSGLTVTPSVVVSSTLIGSPQSVISTDVTSTVAALTVTSHVADLPLTFAVIVVVPVALAIIVPPLTVAILVSLEVQLIVSVAQLGVRVAVNVSVPPTVNSVDCLRDIVLVGTEAAVTVTVQVAFLDLSPFAIAVIVALPTPLAVTTPLVFTVATEVLPEDQVTPLFEASEGEIVAVSVLVVLPYVLLSQEAYVNDIAFLSNEILSTGIASAVQSISIHVFFTISKLFSL